MSVDGTSKPPRKALLIHCRACGADISKCCYAMHAPGQPNAPLVIAVPLRCPECNAPAVQEETVIMPFGGRG